MSSKKLRWSLWITWIVGPMGLLYGTSFLLGAALTGSIAFVVFALAVLLVFGCVQGAAIVLAIMRIERTGIFARWPVAQIVRVSVPVCIIGLIGQVYLAVAAKTHILGGAPELLSAIALRAGVPAVFFGVIAIIRFFQARNIRLALENPAAK